MTTAPAAEPLRSALQHFAFAMSVARDGAFALDDDQGQRDRYAIEGALYLGAASVASASGWLSRQPAQIRYLAYSVVDLDARAWEGLQLQVATDLRLRLQAARVVAGLIEADGMPSG